LTDNLSENWPIIGIRFTRDPACGSRQSDPYTNQRGTLLCMIFIIDIIIMFIFSTILLLLPLSITSAPRRLAFCWARLVPLKHAAQVAELLLRSSSPAHDLHRAARTRFLRHGALLRRRRRATMVAGARQGAVGAGRGRILEETYGNTYMQIYIHIYMYTCKYVL
jgi:hypothetical protein